MKKVISVLLSLAMLVTLFAGCGGGAASTSSDAAPASESASGEASTEPAAEPAADDGETEQLVVGLDILSMAAPFLVAMVQGAQDKAEELGIKLIVSDCNADTQRQVDQVQDFITQEVDAIIIEPWDADAIVPTINDANAAGIPVFTLDTSSNGGEVVCWVASDNIEMGRMGAQYIVDQLYERYGEHRGNVVDLMASLTSTSGTNRTKGFAEVIEQYPDIHIVAQQNADLKPEVALDVMMDVLQANEQIDAVWCSGDNNALGAMQAIEQSGRFLPQDDEGHIIVVSADGAAESIAAIREGKLDACVSQNPIGMAELCMEIVNAYLREGTAPESDFIPYPCFTITNDNIDSGELKEYGIWSELIRE